MVIIGLGCESNQIGAMMDAEKLNPSNTLHAFTIQDCGGSSAAAKRGVGLVRELLPDANRCERVTRPASDLTLALECGGSDGYSGISANPALGVAADLLVRNGGGPDDFSEGGSRSRLVLRNTGQGTFEDVTEASGLLTRRFPGDPPGRPGDRGAGLA